MRLHTFTGLSTGGLDGAVNDAHRDYDQWMADNRRTTVIEGPPIVTANTLSKHYNDGDVNECEYWFTITIIYRERMQ